MEEVFDFFIANWKNIYAYEWMCYCFLLNKRPCDYDREQQRQFIEWRNDMYQKYEDDKYCEYLHTFFKHETLEQYKSNTEN
jgi:hypothetical protein